MAHPIKELAKLTTKSKQIDGMGFGGEAPDNLEVAGILGMPHPTSKKKLSRHAYYLARFAYCGDRHVAPQLKSALLSKLLSVDTGSIREVTLLKLSNAALREFISPEYKTDRYGKTISNNDGQPEIVPVSGREFARRLGVDKKSITRNHEDAYKAVYQYICELDSEVCFHIRAHQNEIEEVV